MSIEIPKRALDIDYSYDCFSGHSNPRIIKQGRASVKDRNFEPHYYRFIFWFFMARHFGPFFKYPVALILIWGVMSLFGVSLVPWYIPALLIVGTLTHSIMRITATFRGILESRVIGHEHHDRPQIKSLPVYKDQALMWYLWSASPYRVTLLRAAHAANLISAADLETQLAQVAAINKTYEALVSSTALTPARSTSLLPALPADIAMCLPAPMDSWDRPEEAVVSQPSEGFCGPATLNTTVCSLFAATPLAMERGPTPLSLHEVMDIFMHHHPGYSPTAPPKCILAEDALARIVSAREVYCSKESDYPAFLAALRLANDPRYRVLVNFLRTPLFNPRPGHMGKKAISLMGGHWSPIAASRQYSRRHGAAQTPREDTIGDAVMILDVNVKFGPFVVDAYDLFMACYTRDGNKYRGLVVIEIADE